MKLDGPTIIAIALFLWGLLNAVSRRLTDNQWDSLPEWARFLIELSRALGPDTVKAYRKGVDLVAKP